MKRRLDLALALVHRPQHPLPRRADDRARPAEPHRALGGGGATRARGRRDRLPDDAVPRGGRRARRPRRHHRPRPHRRRGHAGRPEGGDRPAERHALPRTRRDRGRSPRPRRFGEPLPDATKDVAVRLRDGVAGLADVVRAIDAQELPLAHLEMHAPTLDDVFLAKTGRSLEGAGEQNGGAARGERYRVAGGGARLRSISRTARQPASAIPPLLFPMTLMAVNSAGLEPRPSSRASRPTRSSPSRSPSRSSRARSSRR